MLIHIRDCFLVWLMSSRGFLYRDVFFPAAAAATPLKTLKKRLETIGYPGSTGGSGHAVAAAAARKLAEKWLGYAESDAQMGMSRTNAIKEARRLCKGHDQFADRLAALEAEIERNSAKEQQAAAEKIERRQNRILFPVSALPAMNTPVQHGGATLVFESAGKSFRISEDHPSIEGSHLLGHEGELGCYCYYKKIS